MCDSCGLNRDQAACSIFAADADVLLLAACLENSLMPLCRIGVPRSAWHHNAASIAVCAYSCGLHRDQAAFSVFAADVDVLLLAACLENSVMPLCHIGVPRSAWHHNAASISVCAYSCGLHRDQAAFSIFATDVEVLLLAACLENSLIP